MDKDTNQFNSPKPLQSLPLETATKVMRELQEAGLVIVPAVPSAEMFNAAWDKRPDLRIHQIAKVWKAMIAAA